MRTVRLGAWLILVGGLLSGPLGLLLVQLVQPQPPWRDAATFVAHFHPVQTLPFALGFFLVSGFVVLVAGLDRGRARDRVAMVFTAAFAALIFLNYTLQTTVVPALAASYRAEDGPLLSWITMSQPRALGWALEMWGYGLLGVATWLVAPGRGAVRLAYRANGVVSVVGAVCTALVPGWVMTVPGLAGYAVWNLLVVVMAILTLRQVVNVASTASWSEAPSAGTTRASTSAAASGGVAST